MSSETARAKAAKAFKEKDTDSYVEAQYLTISVRPDITEETRKEIKGIREAFTRIGEDAHQSAEAYGGDE
ncbi:MAG: hypothetical protein MI685_08080 [Chlorobiales bacterium]|nr:hypothetical protein [Chlorobiales bacterium]